MNDDGNTRYDGSPGDTYSEDPFARRKSGRSRLYAALLCGALVLVAAALLIAAFSRRGAEESAAISAYPDELELAAGEYLTVRTVVSPEKHKNDSLIWVSSNPAVATVESGVINARGAGVCKITVALESEARVSAVIIVTVTEEQPEPSPEPEKAAAEPPVVQVFIDIGTVDRALDTTAAPGDVYPNCYMSEAEVSALGLDTIQYYINTIYAKNGYAFKDDSVAAYFDAQPWYEPVSGDADAAARRFSAMDRANMELLTKYRKLRKEAGNEAGGAVGTLWTWSVVNGELSESFVSTLSDYDIQMLINTVYAKNGYIFKTESIQQLFETQYWYSGWTSDTSELRFSRTDEANLALLCRYR